MAGWILGGLLPVGDRLIFEDEQFLLVLELVLDHLEPCLALMDVVSEAGYGVLMRVMVFDLDDTRDDLVEKMAVVGNEDQPPFVLRKPVFQPRRSLQVE